MKQYYSKLKISQYFTRELLNKRTLFLGVIAFCAMILLSVIIISQTVTAQRSVSRTKLITCVEIEQGDTLWGIASEFITDDYDTVTEYVEEIKATNGLSTDTIHAGNSIIIPYYADASKVR